MSFSVNFRENKRPLFYLLCTFVSVLGIKPNVHSRSNQKINKDTKACVFPSSSKKFSVTCYFLITCVLERKSLNFFLINTI